jgi:poly(3-hydroxyalkanoate) depolymerase
MMSTTTPARNDRLVDFVDVRGRRVRYAIQGQRNNPPLLLINGIGANLEVWQPLEERIADRQVISFDAPGAGRSETGLRPIRMRGLAELTLELLDTLGYSGPVDVLGYSFGGAIAQQLAHRRPDRVRRLILAATLPGVGGVPGNPLLIARLLSPRRYYSRRALEAIAHDAYGGRIASDHDALRAHADTRFLAPPTALGYATQLVSIWGWSSLRWLHTLRMPTLILGGDKDPLVPMINNHIFLKLIPNARLHVVRDGGHLFLLDQTEDVVSALRAFLNESNADELAPPIPTVPAGCSAPR